MQRYFVKNDTIENGKIKVNKDDFFHMQKVMRMKSGSQVTCVDEDEHVYLCCLDDQAQPILSIVEELEENHEMDVCVRLIYGLPKLDKFEFVVQKCTELGVKEIVPLLSNRSLIRTDEARFSKKMERLEKIVKEASEQSKRQKLVKIYSPMNLKQALELPFNQGLIAYEEKSREGECQQFEASLKTLKKGDVINIVIGPEGGFDESEVEAFMSHGYKACSLGPRILRSETAPLYMLSVIGFYRELKEEI